MGGGLMQIVAYGAQDVYLTGNSRIRFHENGLRIKIHARTAELHGKINFDYHSRRSLE